MSDSYTPISMIRGNSTIIDSTPIVDGQILFDETRKCLFMDNGSTREKYSGLGADSNIANVEDTTTASQPYTTGEFVVVEGQLYKVTASIATGDTFSVGTNIETDTVGSEITKINADLTELNTEVDTLQNNAFDSAISISANTDFICPSDGYVLMSVGAAVNLANTLFINGVNFGTVIGNGNFGTGRGIFVKKGMTVKITGGGAFVGLV